MRTGNFRFAFAVLLIGASGSANPASFGPEQLKVIDATVSEAVRAQSLPGGAVAITVAGKPVVAKTFGVSDVEGRAPVTRATLFRLGSISKFVTAAAIMRLVETGKLGLDDKVSNHLKDRQDLSRQLGAVTVRQLLNHTSGLPDLVPRALGELVSQNAPIADKHVIAALDRPAPSRPGISWSYNNIGYRLLSWVVEDAVGMRFNDYIVRQLGPALDLESLQPCDLAQSHLSRGYIVSEGKFIADPSYSVRGLLGDGGLCATVEDLVLLPARLQEKDWIDARTVALMVQPTILQDGTLVDYGLGVRRGMVGSQPMWGHSGSGLAGGWAAVAHYPDQQMTIAVVGNGGGGTDDAITLQAKIAASLLNQNELRNNPVEDSIRKMLPLVFEGDDTGVCYEWGSTGVTRRARGSTASPRPMLYQGGGVFARSDYPLDRYAIQFAVGRALAHRVYYDGFFAELLRPSASATC